MSPNDVAKRVIFFLLLLLGFQIAWKKFSPDLLFKDTKFNSASLSRDSIMAADEIGRLIPYIAERLSKAVVLIKAGGYNDGYSMWGQPMRFRRESRGSGMILRKDGLIVTNAHIVAGFSELRVLLKDGREFEATILNVDSLYDIAVLTIDSDSLPVCPIGQSDKLSAGEWVVAIGNPFGLSHSLSFGVISGTGRTDTLANGVSIDYIQTDAAINSGNSGGPLINLDGEVIGMNSFILSPSHGSVGVGFAIPIKRVSERVQKLIK